MGIFDIHPQKFYLLSPKKRTLIDFSTADHDFAKEVDQVFDSIKAIQGGNIHAVYCYYSQILEVMQNLSDKYKDNILTFSNYRLILKDLRMVIISFVREQMFLSWT